MFYMLRVGKVVDVGLHTNVAFTDKFFISSQDRKDRGTETGLVGTRQKLSKIHAGSVYYHMSY